MDGNQIEKTAHAAFEHLNLVVITIAAFVAGTHYDHFLSPNTITKIGDIRLIFGLLLQITSGITFIVFMVLNWKAFISKLNFLNNMKSVDLNPSATLKEVATGKTVSFSGDTATVVFTKEVDKVVDGVQTTEMSEDQTVTVTGDDAQAIHDFVMSKAVPAPAPAATETGTEAAGGNSGDASSQNANS